VEFKNDLQDQEQSIHIKDEEHESQNAMVSFGHGQVMDDDEPSEDQHNQTQNELLDMTIDKQKKYRQDIEKLVGLIK
jgi:hypothetical protein